MRPNVIKVFISSTFIDLEEERKEVKTAIEGLIPAYEKFGIHLSPVDLKNGARPNPPKDECLREVERCNILIGIVGSRYGSIDPETGKSITELEYECAKEKNIDCLFYIRNSEYIKQEWVETSQEKIEKLERFKSRVNEALKRDTFDGSQQLRGNISRDLTWILNDKYVDLENSSEIFQTKSIESESVSPDVTVGEANDEIVLAFNSIKMAIKQGGEISDKEKERLHLFANGLYYMNNRDGIIGNHEIHRLYLNRDDIKLSGFEGKYILKTLLSDEYNLKAGWYLLRDVEVKAVRWYLRWLCFAFDTTDQEKYLKKLSHFWPSNFLSASKEIIHVANKETTLSLLPMIVSTGSGRGIKLIESVIVENDNELEVAQKKALLRLMAKNGKQERLFTLLKSINESESNKYNNELAEIAGDLEIAFLIQLKDQDFNTTLRELAILELTKRDELSQDSYRANLESKDLDLRYHSYMNLIESGVSFKMDKVRKDWPQDRQTLLGNIFSKGHLRDKITKAIYEAYNSEQLKSHINWTGIDAPLAYMIYGLREYENVKDIIKSDLANDFKRIKDEYFSTISTAAKDAKELLAKKEPTPELLAVFKPLLAQRSESLKELEKLHGYIVNQFKYSALEVIYQKGEMDDKEYLKKEIVNENYGVQEIAKKLFVKLASSDDIDEIVKLAIEGGHNIKILAGKMALAIEDGDGILDKFISTNDKDLITLAFAFAVENNIKIEQDVIFEVMYAENENIRELAIAYLLKKGTTKKKFEKILDKYTSRQSYYYNVVGCIDKILYAPKVIKINARKELVGRLKVQA